jgi:hypothetical protein
MAPQPPGSEFLERRLARATAVPPAERSPEVGAFVEAMQLLLEARELLPVPKDQEAPPNTPKTRRQVRLVTRPQHHLLPWPCHPQHVRLTGQAAVLPLSMALQVLLAMLKAARAGYICPDYPPADKNQNHFIIYLCTLPLFKAAFFGSMQPPTSASASDSDSKGSKEEDTDGAGELAEVLTLYTAAPIIWGQLVPQLMQPLRPRRVTQLLLQAAAKSWKPCGGSMHLSGGWPTLHSGACCSASWTSWLLHIGSRRGC